MPQSEVEKTLKALIAVADTSGTASDLVAAFETIVKAYLAIKSDTEKERTARDAEFAAALTKLRSRIDSRLGELHGIDGHTPTPSELTALIRPLIPHPIEPRVPTNAELIALIQPLIPPAASGEDGEDGSPDTADDIRNKLELLPDGEKLKIDAIEGLRRELDALGKRLGSVGFNMASQAGRDIFSDIDLSAQLDGVMTTFNIHAVYNIISVSLSSFPNALRKGVDFSYTPTTITFIGLDPTTQLAVGQTCVLTVVNG